jgi:phospho-N-acetylmuramoyl-pentapeptide-transferase
MKITPLVPAFLIAFAVVVVLGRFFIPFMRKIKAGQSILEIGPKWHLSKQGTPTMGGILFIAGILAACVATGAGHTAGGKWIHILIWLFATFFGAIGFLDDYVKVAKKRNMGLTAPQKLLLQLAVSLAFISLMRLWGVVTPNLYIPFANISVPLPWIWYMLFSVLVITGGANAINFTDGVDGLLSAVTLPVMLFFTAVALLDGATEIGILSVAAAGALLGFLIYNFNPAKVFMGDTGSLFLGGLVMGIAFALDIPLIIVIVGAIYIIEILSVVIQVVYFKITNGKRIFRMAPIHHHFEMGGWSEKKICLVFGLVTLGLCLVAFAALIGKYRL